MKFDITDLARHHPFTGQIVVVLGRSPWNIRALLKFRAQLTKHADNVFIIQSRRFRSLHDATARILRLTGLKIGIVCSPEPRRHALTVNRILQAADSAQITFLNDSYGCAALELERLLAAARDSNDSDLISLRSLSSSGNVPTRIDATAVTVSGGVSAVIGDLDESFICFQDVIDDLHGRITMHSLRLKTLASNDGQDQPSLHPRNSGRYPWLGVSMQLPSRTSAQRGHHADDEQAVTQDLSILIDLRDWNFQLNGTSQHTSSTIEAFSTIEGFATTVAMSDRVENPFKGDSPVEILIAPTDAALRRRDFDVSFVVKQIESTKQAEQHRSLARYVVVSHLDVIAYTNPSYFPDVDTWQASQQQTFDALRMVDGIAWLTDSVRNSVKELRLVDNVAQEVCGTVIPHRSGTTKIPQRNESKPLVATIGTSYHHKSRMYSLRVFHQMVTAGWSGDLVLAGWSPPIGSSKLLEEEFVQSHGLVGRVSWVEGLENDEIAELITTATALIQPSSLEGFGLVPFEAGLLGTPVFVAKRSSMKALLPEDFDGWLTNNPARDAERILDLTEAHTQEIVTQLQQVAMNYSTEMYAQRLERLIRDVAGATS